MKNFLFIFLLLFNACKFFGSGDKGEAIAKVNGEYLYPSDILGPDYKAEDSSLINPGLVDIWIAQELWYEKAKKSNISIDVDQQLEDFKKSLYVAAYQESILAEANIEVGDAEILEYYKNNKAQFLVKEDLFKLQYFIVPESQDLDPVLSNINEGKPDAWLDGYCKENESKCLQNAIWVGTSVLEDLTIPDVFWTTSVKYQSYYKSDNTVCVFRIVEKRKQGENAPLAQVKEEIALLLKHQKEKVLLLEEENTLLLNAQNKNKIEKY